MPNLNLLEKKLLFDLFLNTFNSPLVDYGCVGMVLLACLPSCTNISPQTHKVLYLAQVTSVRLRTMVRFSR